MWPNSVTGKKLNAVNQTSTWNIPSSDMECAERDYGKCGVQFSEPRSIVRPLPPPLIPAGLRNAPGPTRRALPPPQCAVRTVRPPRPSQSQPTCLLPPLPQNWCPINSPVRLPPLIPTPIINNRAAVPGFIALENATDFIDNGDSDDFFTGPNIPMTVLYTGGSRGLADQVAALITNQATAAATVSQFVNQALTPLVQSLDLSFRDISKLQFVSVLMQLLGSYGAASVVNGSTPQGNRNLNLVGGTPLLGVARKMPPILQTDSGYQPGQSMYFVVDDCDDAPALTAAASAQLVATFATTTGGFATRVRGGNASSGAPPALPCGVAMGSSATVSTRQALCLLGLITQGTPLQCLGTRRQWLPSTGGINEQLFTGYGRGTPAQQGSDTVYNASAVQQYPFALDFADSNNGRASPRFALNLWYNNTDLLTQQGPIRYRRIPAIMNAITNAYLNSLLPPSDPTLCAGLPPSPPLGRARPSWPF